jgi:hypothetical protein
MSKSARKVLAVRLLKSQCRLSRVENYVGGVGVCVSAKIANGDMCETELSVSGVGHVVDVWFVAWFVYRAPAALSNNMVYMN